MLSSQYLRDLNEWAFGSIKELILDKKPTTESQYNNDADLLCKPRVYTAISSEKIRQSLNIHEKKVYAIKVRGPTLGRSWRNVR